MRGHEEIEREKEKRKRDRARERERESISFLQCNNYVQYMQKLSVEHLTKFY